MVALQVPDHLKFPFPAGSWAGRIPPLGGVAARVDALSHPTYRSHGPGLDGLRRAGRAYALAFASPVLAENSSEMRGGRVMRRDRKLPSQTPVLFARRLARLSAAFLIAGMCLSWPALSAQAQEAAIIQPGATAVTGFSGTIVPRPDRDLPPGADPLDETFIDTAGATLRIFDLSRLGGPATGQLVAT